MKIQLYQNSFIPSQALDILDRIVYIFIYVLSFLY